MDEITRLIRQFEEEDTQSLADPDYSDKVEIIQALEDFNDEMVTRFFLRVIENFDEYDLARIEVLKIFKIKIRGESLYDAKIGKAIQRILLNDADDDVRTYAAMAISNYMDIDGALDIVKSILLNRSENINIRSSAFYAIEKVGPLPESINTIKICLLDNQFVKSASKLLVDWKEDDDQNG